MVTQTKTHDGLIDVTKMGSEAGFRCQVVITPGAWADCVEWTEEDDRREPSTLQDQDARLSDVLWMALCGVQSQRTGREEERLECQLPRVPEFSKRDGSEKYTVLYRLERVPRGKNTRASRMTALKLVTSLDNNGVPVVIIMLPHEVLVSFHPV